jgi:hypothetical protein
MKVKVRSKGEMLGLVRVQVLTATRMKVVVCGMLRHVVWAPALMIEAVSTSEKSVSFYQTTWEKIAATFNASCHSLQNLFSFHSFTQKSKNYYIQN